MIVIVTMIGGFLAFRTWGVLNSFPTELMSTQYDIGELGIALVDPERFALPFEVYFDPAAGSAGRCDLHCLQPQGG